MGFRVSKARLPKVPSIIRTAALVPFCCSVLVKRPEINRAKRTLLGPSIQGLGGVALWIQAGMLSLPAKLDEIQAAENENRNSIGYLSSFFFKRTALDPMSSR